MDALKLKEKKVGIADAAISISPNKLITLGLGSCIGVAFYDKKTKIGGLLHIMLPDSSKFNNVENLYKYADTGIPLVIKEMEKMGANISRITAKIAGGASMFNFSDKKIKMDIGKRNSDAVKKILSYYKIPILAEEIGGTKGRTMIFKLESGLVEIRTLGVLSKEI